MVSKRPNRKSYLEKEPQYPLDEVKRLIRDGKIILIERARIRAWKSLGWRRQDISNAILKLQPKDFCKREQERKPPWGVLDIYKPKRKINGELIYLHYSINDDDYLVIDSCHEQE